MTYTYSIFDADPNSSSGCVWPDYDHVEIEADDDESAVELAVVAAESAAYECRRDDGYSEGDLLYILVWDADGTLIGDERVEITTDHLGGPPSEEVDR